MAVMLAMVMLTWCSAASSPASPAPISGTWVERIDAQAVDSARYVVHWEAPAVGPRQYEIASYDVRLAVDGATQWIEPQPRVARLDTFAVAMPALGDTLTLQVAVRAVDTAGQVSEWAIAPAWSLSIDALPPSPPTGVGVDTLAPRLVFSRVSPDVMVGAPVRQCALLVSGGHASVSQNQVEFPECRDFYSAWRAEGDYSPADPIIAGDWRVEFRVTHDDPTDGLMIQIDSTGLMRTTVDHAELPQMAAIW